MQKLTITLWVFALGLLINDYAAGKTVGKKVTARKVAAVSAPRRAVIRASASNPNPPEKSWNLRFALASGYATTNSNNKTDQAIRTSGGTDQNIYFGLSADLQVQRYFGLELEGFVSSATEKETTSSDIVNGAQRQTRSLQPRGAMANVKVQYPVPFGIARITPKLGAGYGLLGLRETIRAEGSENEVQSTLSVKGPYATLGVEISLFEDFMITGDYARSFSGNGDRSLAGIGNVASGSELNSPRFERFRIGAYYRIADPFVIGTQYVRRQLRYEVTGETVATQETFNQFLGVIMVGF